MQIGFRTEVLHLGVQMGRRCSVLDCGDDVVVLLLSCGDDDEEDGDEWLGCNGDDDE